MKRVLIFLSQIVTLCTLSLTSCIDNDIPYPVVSLDILDVQGDGFSLKSIDTKNGVATISLEETTDIQAVTITNVECTADAKFSNIVVGTFDMRSALQTSLYLYQYYDWSIVAEQSISRSFKVVGQIGEERIDTTQNTVEVDVNENSVDLDNVTVTYMKLGPELISTYSPTLEELTNSSFSSVRQVKVTAHDRSDTWRIYINPIAPSVTLSVDTWGTIAWLSASGDTTTPEDCSFKYRKSGDTNWIDVAATTVSDGTFSTKITGLLPSTEYEFEAFAGDYNSGEMIQSTESTPLLQNGGFEGWQKIGNAWYPYAVGDDEYWGTGNKGASILSSNSNITLPDSEIAPGSSGDYSALLESSSVVSVFAAGNIFTGRFVDIAGTSGGIIGMGRPFTQRPLSLRGWAKYTQGTVTHTDSSNMLSKGDPDMGSIYIALGTWDAATYGYDANGNLLGDSTTPIIIDTRDKSTFFNSNSDDVIAYGELILTQDQDWSEFEIDLEYHDLTDSNGNIIEKAESRIPTHILIVCTSSRYGDYFTGSTSSKLLLDEFELLYE